MVHKYTTLVLFIFHTTNFTQSNFWWTQKGFISRVEFTYKCRAFHQYIHFSSFIFTCTSFLMLFKVEKDPYEEEDIFEESEMMNVGIVQPPTENGDPKKSTHLDTKGTLPPTL